MVHPHTNKGYTVARRATVYTAVGVVYATTETLTARRTMEYDLRQYPCLCCCQHLVTLVLYYYYFIC